MNALLRKLSPGATDMIRMDHSRVLAAFHRYDLDASPRRKRGLVNTICLALEVHARMEEEVFYPAMRAAGSTQVDKSVPEHKEMRSLIAALRRLDPAGSPYDATFMELMRLVIHHVADEETMLLPHAESILGQRLNELGARMAKRRLQLALPRAGEMAGNTARMAGPGGILVLAAGALIAGMVLLGQDKKRSHPRVAS